MKIAFLSEKYTPDLGGLAISAERLAGLLASAGYDVRVFAPTLNLPASKTRTLPRMELALHVSVRTNAWTILSLTGLSSL